MNHAQLVVLEPAYGLGIDRASVNPDERSDDRSVLLGQIESLGIEVIEARVLAGPHDLALTGG